MSPGALHPDVGALKFQREVAQFEAQRDRMREHGAWLLEVTEPMVLVAFASPNLQPTAIVTAVRFDYSDFDLQAPSVVFVNPFTGEPLRPEQLHTQMVRGIEQPLPAGMPAAVAQDGTPMQQSIIIPQMLIQAHEGGMPFLCLPGVREYHAHPAHSGDPWELHRTTGAGSLVRLVETIRKYAVEPVTDWNVQLITRVGLATSGPPPL